MKAEIYVTCAECGHELVVRDEELEGDVTCTVLSIPRCPECDGREYSDRVDKLALEIHALRCDCGGWESCDLRAARAALEVIDNEVF